MSTAEVLLSTAIIPELTGIFEASPSCDWGGVLLGEISEKDGIVTTIVYGAVPAAYKKSFLDEFRTNSQMWKEFYTERDRHYPDAKIVGWYYYSPASGQPPKQNIDIHKTFFDTPGQVFLFLDRNGTPHCYQKSESGDSLIPVISSEFTGQYSPGGNCDSAGDSKPEATSNLCLKIGLKKAGLFLVFFAICVLGLMYKDLTNPIVDSSRATPIPPVETASSPADTALVSPSEDKSAEPDIDIPAILVSENTSQPEPIYYIVQKGDSLWVISEKFYGTGFKFYKILESNNIFNPRNLYAGQKLTIQPESKGSDLRP
ncbi:LysM peptidoglycan-binding domain-containing protein [Phosphitispora fastidiosa]|uniref:LysM peptidoglycan-binding domain-containing protein n=1 Tax=Phosphitispora fastidiosa TaxID=2837202 RepID=UPI001E50AEEB|nr:LysM peptidoglycan-binding domain-containing protein [Phosphitispora fastidiosa]MBU7005355.1 LysM repeat protein [Phosphitispora fastidiosa]